MSELNNTNNDEISIKDIIASVVDILKYLKSKWVYILSTAFIVGCIGVLIAYVSKPTYTAKLTFALDEEKGTGFGQYEGIASQFGIDLGGNASGIFSNTNLIEFLKSRKMIERTLITPIVFKNKQTNLIEAYLDVYEKRKDFNEEDKNISFLIDEDKFTIKHDSIINLLYAEIISERMAVDKIDKKVNIITVNFTSQDQILSKLFCEKLILNVSDFYIETKTRKSRNNVNTLQSRVDSVKRELDKALYGRALASDQNLLVVRQQANVGKIKQEVNVQVLSTMYTELTKNLELAKFSLLNNEPLFQIIDKPTLPFKKNKKSKLIHLIVGGFIGLILSSSFLLLKRWINTAFSIKN